MLSAIPDPSVSRGSSHGLRLQVDATPLGGRAGMESAQGPRTGASQGHDLVNCLGMTIG